MSLWTFGGNADATAFALLLAEALRIGPQQGPEGPVPYGVELGIQGVGLFHDGNALVPALFVPEEKATNQLESRPLDDFPGLRGAVNGVLETTRLAVTPVVVPVSSVIPFAGPGDTITGALQGVLGAPVAWGTSRGHLTAGHVAPAGRVVTDRRGSAIARSVWPVSGPPPKSVDVAVLETLPGVQPGGGPPITQAATAGPLANVDVHAGPWPALAQIIAMAAWFVVTRSGNALADVYLTRTGVTAAGNSGSPVLLQGTDRVVGHVVAGGSGTTCIQDIGTQLTAIRADAAFASIAI